MYNNMTVNLDGMQGTIQSDGQVRFGNDNHTNVHFYKKSILDPIKSREQGRPYYIPIDYVRIQQPGEHLNIIDRPVADEPNVTRRWPQHWERYQNNQQVEVPEGTPLELMFPINPEIPANLHTHAVHTVEQLANLTAFALESIGMGAVEWQGRARKFLDSAKGGQEHHRMVKQLEEMRSKNEVLQNQISLMQTQLNRLAAAAQGVPPMMISNAAPTQAQQYNTTIQASTAYSGPFAEAPVDTPTPEPTLFDNTPKPNKSHLFKKRG